MMQAGPAMWSALVALVVAAGPIRADTTGLRTMTMRDQLFIKKCIQLAGRFAQARIGFGGAGAVEFRDRVPHPPPWAPRCGVGRIGGNKDGVGQGIGKAVAKPKDRPALGAKSVQQHHKTVGLARGGRKKMMGQ